MWLNSASNKSKGTRSLAKTTYNLKAEDTNLQLKFNKQGFHRKLLLGKWLKTGNLLPSNTLKTLREFPNKFQSCKQTDNIFWYNTAHCTPEHPIFSWCPPWPCSWLRRSRISVCRPKPPVALTSRLLSDVTFMVAYGWSSSAPHLQWLLIKQCLGFLAYSFLL